MSVVSVPARGHGGTQSRVDRIVIHGTVGPCEPGHSVSIARYLNTKGLSVHEIVDPTTVTVMLPDHTVAYGDGYNTAEWQIELCDPQAGDPRRWDDDAHEAMLRLAAARVRAACQRLEVPMVRITAPLQGKRGICGHADITNTPGFGNTTHTDPDAGGPFPWARFLAKVNQQEQEDDLSAADVKAINDFTATRIGAIDRNSVIRHGEVIARVAAVEAALAASPDNPITQEQLNEAVAKALQGASITIEPGGTK